MQKNIRSRVSFVESIEKDAADTVTTYYTYDIHGNVKSLLQQVPNFEPKRIDYVYDIITNKIKYLMYQYDKPDEFTQQYTYDSDDRIKEVSTSSDGFIWDRDALYKYYLHGPLARIEH
jgi:YD repeat-containing protein